MAILWSGEEILEMAVQIEKNGIAFYQGLAESARDGTMKKLMEDLAEEEKKHMATFQKFSGVMDKEQLKTLYDLQHIEEVSLFLRALADTKIFADSNEAARWARETKSLSEAFATAIDLEKDSVLFYLEMWNFVRKEDQDLIDKIIDEEKKHIQTLTKLKEEYVSERGKPQMKK